MGRGQTWLPKECSPANSPAKHQKGWARMGSTCYGGWAGLLANLQQKGNLFPLEDPLFNLKASSAKFGHTSRRQRQGVFPTLKTLTHVFTVSQLPNAKMPVVILPGGHASSQEHPEKDEALWNFGHRRSACSQREGGTLNSGGWLSLWISLPFGLGGLTRTFFFLACA